MNLAYDRIRLKFLSVVGLRWGEGIRSTNFALDLEQ
jgi:hypothetical protein